MWSRDRLVKPPARDAHAVEPELIEPMRGGFKGEMRDTVACDLVELAMQCDRIGRGQRAVDGAFRRHQSDGADAGGDVAKPLPDLPREGSDRSLAAGAGDRRDGLGLPRIEFCCRKRQRPARIRRDHERHADARLPADDRPRPQPRLRRSAASMKRAPSVLLPASAKNRSPGFTTRLSTARPVTVDPRPACGVGRGIRVRIAERHACGSIVASSLKRSRSS